MTVTLPPFATAAANAGTASNTNAAITLPGSIAGKVGVIALSSNTSSAMGALSTAGWTQRGVTTGANANCFLQVWTKQLVAGDNGATLGGTGSLTAAGRWCIVFACYDTALDFDNITFHAAPNTNQVTTVPVDAITPVANDCAELAICAFRPFTSGATGTLTVPAGWSAVEIQTTTSNATNNNQALGIADVSIVGGAGTPTSSTTAGVTNSNSWVTATLTLAPTVVTATFVPQTIRPRVFRTTSTRRAEIGQPLPITAIWLPQRNRPRSTWTNTTRRAHVTAIPLAPAGARLAPTAVRRRTLRPATLRRTEVYTPTPAQVVIAAPAWVPQRNRPRLRWLPSTRRASLAQPVPAQVVVVAPAWTPQATRRRIVAAKVNARIRGAQPVPAPVVVAVAVWTPQAIRRRITSAKVNARARSAQPTPAPVIAAAAVWTPQAVRRRIIAAKIGLRTRAAQPILATVAALIPGAVRRRIVAAKTSTRRRGAQPVPVAVVIAPTFVLQPGRRRRPTMAPKRPHGYQYVPAQVAAVTVTPGSMRRADATTATMRPGGALAATMRAPAPTASTMRPGTANTATMRPTPAGVATMRRATT